MLTKKHKKIQFAGSSYNNSTSKLLKKMLDVDSELKVIEKKLKEYNGINKLSNNVESFLNNTIKSKKPKKEIKKNNLNNSNLNSRILKTNSLLKDIKSKKRNKRKLLIKKDTLLKTKIAIAIAIIHNIDMRSNQGIDIKKESQLLKGTIRTLFSAYEYHLLMWKLIITKLFDPNRPKIPIYDKNSGKIVRHSFNHILEGDQSRKLKRNEFLLPLDIFEQHFDVKVIRKTGEDFILVKDRLRAISCLTSNGLFDFFMIRKKKTKSPMTISSIKELVMCSRKIGIF